MMRRGQTDADGTTNGLTASEDKRKEESIQWRNNPPNLLRCYLRYMDVPTYPRAIRVRTADTFLNVLVNETDCLRTRLRISVGIRRIYALRPTENSLMKLS